MTRGMRSTIAAVVLVALVGWITVQASGSTEVVPPAVKSAYRVDLSDVPGMNHQAPMAARIFDRNWWIEKVITPLLLAILVSRIESNWDSMWERVRQAMGWTARFANKYMFEEAARQTCEAVGDGYAESLVRANNPGASDDEVAEMVYNLSINCAGINELDQIALSAVGVV